MRVVIQRVKEASCVVENQVVGKIDNGLLLFVGVTHDDNSEDVDYLVRKIVNMRIFEDENQKMNLSLKDKGYDILSISQFTLFAETRHGNRPGFSNAADPKKANELYEEFNEKLRLNDVKVETGVFGAMMEIKLINDGPVTILIDSKNK
ncbi:TPA: D-tyrosyl-tRNA(Tyr) deacylase [bacterium]|nr:D-tyrosyl-tRNA(Tyr) deacylase [bacterium]